MLGRTYDATRHFEGALTLNTKTPAWLPHAQLAFAPRLRASGDYKRAAQLEHGLAVLRPQPHKQPAGDRLDECLMPLATQLQWLGASVPQLPVEVHVVDRGPL